MDRLPAPEGVNARRGVRWHSHGISRKPFWLVRGVTRGSARRYLPKRSTPSSPVTPPRARPSCAIWSTRRWASKHSRRQSINPPRACIACSHRTAIRVQRTSSTLCLRCRKKRASNCASRPRPREAPPARLARQRPAEEVKKPRRIRWPRLSKTSWCCPRVPIPQGQIGAIALPGASRSNKQR